MDWLFGFVLQVVGFIVVLVTLAQYFTGVE